jgi:hypothetical protein
MFWRDHHEVVRLGDWLIHRHGQVEVVRAKEFEGCYHPLIKEASDAVASV